ncbi:MULTISPECIES: SRPBCC family protein [unclassified Tolypothrix]|uniref:SRPBCC family protein n=1 Tax=unclassified Tolypothrix TaxID=2649714 RepID=UPI0005EAC185|nr:MULTISPECIES: SRPBCC family protein [unclassified Tolypothrix]BAY93073.1 cyclase/dehydrase [Microchaete diplosiphon NIES-3275]EKF00319.1 polyketide cyclase/dehydrase [Tolypothrix sp. PCC 7601]MBE9085916.1 SRPBCC family protein [Tolypothrix sp. LEGE 11397]UYD26956.1 SRPBCC family protein [Tolypothrix sp. PCC 7712]UYD37185.1 SRPBCC family protein [Tolypothrix sp. PCC 7601]
MTATPGDQINTNQGEASEAERWASLIGGGAMVLMGLKQGSLRGALTALAGGGLIYQGVTKQSTIQQAQEIVGMNKPIKVEKTVTINKSPEELYRYWHDFEKLPTFMKHLKSVKVDNEKRSHWIANAPLGNSVEWDADILEDRENQFISWASVEGADVDNSGFVRFQKAPGDRGTEVKVVLEYNPPGGALAAVFAKLFGEEPEQQIGDDLRRFKMLMEAGEIATTEGQPSGRSH